MAVYKLRYFNLRGRAELARLLFHYAGQEFEDIHIGFEDWPTLKQTMPFKQLPVLEVDGQSLSQSNAIARYLASKFKLNGQTDLETALSNMYVDHIEDLMSGMRPMIMVILHEKDDAKLKELADKYLTDNLAPHVSLVEKQLKANGTGYLVGSGLTLADIAYYSFMSMAIERFVGENILADAPMLKALVDKVGNIPNIKKYVDSRPKTII